MTYTISPQPAQDDLIAQLRALYPNHAVIKNGLVDQDDSTIRTLPSGSVEAFLVVWFHMPRRTRRGRSFATTRLDQRMASADIVAIGGSPNNALDLANDVYDKIIGRKLVGSGAITEAERQLWSDARQIDIANRPSRWMVPVSIEWGANSTKTV